MIMDHGDLRMRSEAKRRRGGRGGASPRRDGGTSGCPHVGHDTPREPAELIAEFESWRDLDAEDAGEVKARAEGLSFVRLSGNVGCVVNGAGLAMATMDLVKYYGGDPANFLDIGGSSNPEKVVNALKIITADPSVRAILFNIFGGITRTDDVANGIKAALEQFPVQVPIVVRLTGTNEQEAVKILRGIGMTALSDMDEAVAQVVKLVREAA